MRSTGKSRGKFTSAGFVALLAAILAVSSCGSTQGSGFGQNGQGSSSGAGGDGGQGGDDGPLCLSGNCSGGPGFDGSFGDASGIVQNKVDAGVVVDQCTGSSIGASTVTSLEAGGTVDPAMKWLYPYDQTIFPGGLLAPVLQWAPQSGTTTAVYLHMKSDLFEYKGCFAQKSPMQLTVPAAAWNGAWNQSNGASDPVEVQITTIAGTTVSGPITEHWTFALGSLKGIIYYNTYTSQIAGNNGAVMMLKPGASAPTALLAIAGTASPVPTGPCISCHSLSADGSMLVAQKHFYPGGLISPGSMSFNLKSGLPNAMNPANANAPYCGGPGLCVASTMNDDWGFSAVYPDGSRILTAGEATSSSMVTALFPDANTNNPGMIGVKANVMYDPTTGNTINYSGLQGMSSAAVTDAGAGPHAMMPMFSPDGTKIVYNDVDNHGGHGLIVQSFDKTTNTFSSPVLIYNDASNYPGWPFFTPDSKNVVFSMGPGSNYATIPPASFSGVGPVQASASDVSSANLYIVSLATPGTAQALNLANGYRNGALYLPFGTRDKDLNFYPTGSPVAAGGYFWVFFTSRRQYGNVMVDTTNNNAVPDPVFHAETKKIWVTALTIGFNEGQGGDPSHPAFLLPGQELVSGNIRAFAALAPCVANGASCTTGIDCCGGYCTNGTCNKPMTCSTVDNACVTNADCCSGTGLQCIDGFCAMVAPQ